MKKKILIFCMYLLASCKNAEADGSAIRSFDSYAEGIAGSTSCPSTNKDDIYDYCTNNLVKVKSNGIHFCTRDDMNPANMKHHVSALPPGTACNKDSKCPYTIRNDVKQHTGGSRYYLTLEEFDCKEYGNPSNIKKLKRSIDEQEHLCDVIANHHIVATPPGLSCGHDPVIDKPIDECPSQKVIDICTNDLIKVEVEADNSMHFCTKDFKPVSSVPPGTVCNNDNLCPAYNILENCTINGQPSEIKVVDENGNNHICNLETNKQIVVIPDGLHCTPVN